MNNLASYCGKTDKHSLSSRIFFGKYSGCTINEIGEIDSQYILFLYEKNMINPDQQLLTIIEEIYNGNSTDADHSEDFEWLK